ncbi:CRISPR-associated endoribonuclease Cas6 [Fulvivirga maritima]|uniref:CRISPR-associated endoribonuclease Cas6 n=1 Tax=Fulvivirga maritima TaxID=2904247 RepID=UPI001F3E13C2|nr:CRISPR-associated endoribonuclease Cas6 [Fulvivirga maritima]UII25135.1 CRISPR-associated endoribonuclease Cas6 [Fulvivirga maritima]
MKASLFLPVNYQYYISSWIYKSIAAGNSKYAEFLHDKGYGERNKFYKFFNFSALDIRPYYLHKEKGLFELLGNHASIEIGFLLPEAAEHFINGINKANDTLNISSSGYQLALKVSEIRVVPPPLMMGTMTYKLISPCCVTRPAHDGERYTQFLAPQDKAFKEKLMNNLKLRHKKAAEVLSLVGDSSSQEPDINIEIIKGNHRSKLISVKQIDGKNIKIRGWLFSCNVSASTEVQELIWSTGLGEKGSMGFGMVTV